MNKHVVGCTLSAIGIIVTANVSFAANALSNGSFEPGPGYFRFMTPEKRAAIVKFYEDSALRMYQGLTRRMADYAKNSAARERRLGALFQTAQTIRCFPDADVTSTGAAHDLGFRDVKHVTATSSGSSAMSKVAGKPSRKQPC